MRTVVFVPVSDELLFDHPELIETPLVPYRPGMRLTPVPPRSRKRNGRQRLIDTSVPGAIDARESRRD